MPRGKGRVSLVNTTGYDTRQLKRFLEEGARAHGVKKVRVAAVVSPNRTRGCADIGGSKHRMVLQVAPPAKFSKKKLARIYEHELKHIKGMSHEDMDEQDYWSKGPEPEWSRDLPLAHKQRGKSILPK